MKQEEEFDHVGFMGDPLEWPWFVCPIKRWKNGLLEVAMLMGNGPLVYHFGMYDQNVDLDKVRKDRYESFEKIYEDGWRVD